MPVGAPRSWPRRPRRRLGAAPTRFRAGPRSAGVGVTGVPDTAGPGDWLLDPDTARSAAERLGKLVDEHARTHPLAPACPARRRVERSRCPTRSCWPRCSNMRTPSRWTTAGSCDATPRPGFRSPSRRRPPDCSSGGRTSPSSLPARASSPNWGSGTANSRPVPGRDWSLRSAGASGSGRGGGRRRRGAPELPETFTPSEARTRLGTSRRVIMPLLEVLAREGRTRRTGEDGHVVA